MAPISNHTLPELSNLQCTPVKRPLPKKMLKMVYSWLTSFASVSKLRELVLIHSHATQGAPLRSSSLASRATAARARARARRSSGPRLRASNQKPPGAQTPISNLPGPISNLQSASRRDPQSPMSNARPGLSALTAPDLTRRILNPQCCLKLCEN